MLVEEQGVKPSWHKILCPVHPHLRDDPNGRRDKLALWRQRTARVAQRDRRVKQILDADTGFRYRGKE